MEPLLVIHVVDEDFRLTDVQSAWRRHDEVIGGSDVTSSSGRETSSSLLTTALHFAACLDPELCPARNAPARQSGKITKQSAKQATPTTDAPSAAQRPLTISSPSSRSRFEQSVRFATPLKTHRQLHPTSELVGQTRRGVSQTSWYTK